MSAQHNLPSFRAAWNRLALAGVAIEKLEHCDGCRRMFPLRQVELVGNQMLCADCSPSELAVALHPFLPPHPPLSPPRPRAGK
jgi:recombinational DNA repair protein (RecF pathway)